MTWFFLFEGGLLLAYSMLDGYAMYHVCASEKSMLHITCVHMYLVCISSLLYFVCVLQ